MATWACKVGDADAVYFSMKEEWVVEGDADLQNALNGLHEPDDDELIEMGIGTHVGAASIRVQYAMGVFEGEIVLGPPPEFVKGRVY